MGPSNESVGIAYEELKVDVTCTNVVGTEELLSKQHGIDTQYSRLTFARDISHISPILCYCRLLECFKCLLRRWIDGKYHALPTSER